MKSVLFYESADDVLSKAPAHYAAHAAHAAQFHTRGTLLMIGVFANAEQDGAMGVFTTHEAAEEFAQTDPFVINGVVRRFRILEWKEILARSGPPTD